MFTPNLINDRLYFFDKKFDASPVAVGNELFLRGHKTLYCLAEK